MEFINKIELAGVVGQIRRQNIYDQTMANFSLVTEHSFTDHSGCAVIETTWFNVTAWKNKSMPELDKIERGSQVHVVGRLRARRYVDGNGYDHITFDVVASEVSLAPCPQI